MQIIHNSSKNSDCLDVRTNTIIFTENCILKVLFHLIPLPI